MNYMEAVDILRRKAANQPVDADEVREAKEITRKTRDEEFAAALVATNGFDAHLVPVISTDFFKGDKK